MAQGRYSNHTSDQIRKVINAKKLVNKLMDFSLRHDPKLGNKCPHYMTKDQVLTAMKLVDKRLPGVAVQQIQTQIDHQVTLKWGTGEETKTVKEIKDNVAQEVFGPNERPSQAKIKPPTFKVL